MPSMMVTIDSLLDGFGFDPEERDAIYREREKRMEQQHHLFAYKKLVLVLDLDHTLLNSAKASKLFELHICTMGNKRYATEMASLLDPTGVMFNGRVISRGDDNDVDERILRTKSLDGVLGMESSVLIMDDTMEVWPHNNQNLIVIEKYTYFPSSRRQFGLVGPSLLEVDRDERTKDGSLASMLAVIERIHRNFFFNPTSLNYTDVRVLLASEQRSILSGCRILFSRIIPVGESNPHLHPLWRTAEQFGAVCTNQVDDQVTHVVTNSLGTDKVNWAMSTGRHVVKPGWVEASALLYRRVDEHDFYVKPCKKRAQRGMSAEAQCERSPLSEQSSNNRDNNTRNAITNKKSSQGWRVREEAQYERILHPDMACAQA